MLTEDERDFRLRPRKPRLAKTDNTAVAFVALVRQARQLRRVARTAMAHRRSITHLQRCAVRAPPDHAGHPADCRCIRQQREHRFQLPRPHRLCPKPI